MSHIDQSNPYAVNLENAVVSAPESERAAFIRRTYTHLTGAILALIGLEFVLFTVVTNFDKETACYFVWAICTPMVLFADTTYDWYSCFGLV